MIGRKIFGIIFISLALGGCALSDKNATTAESWSYPLSEPDWVREGQPIDYDGAKWFPTRDVENLLDSEVYPLGEYKGVKFFFDRTDIKPFERIYTQFGRNRYRAFEKTP